MKTKRILRFLAAAVGGMALIGTVGCDREREVVGDGVGVFDDWDTDRDGFLSDQEYRSRYNTWDRDRDGRISRMEFEADD